MTTKSIKRAGKKNSLFHQNWTILQQRGSMIHLSNPQLQKYLNMFQIIEIISNFKSLQSRKVFLTESISSSTTQVPIIEKVCLSPHWSSSQIQLIIMSNEPQKDLHYLALGNKVNLITSQKTKFETYCITASPRHWLVKISIHLSVPSFHVLTAIRCTLITQHLIT